jgi:hypothetical protein
MLSFPKSILLTFWIVISFCISSPAQKFLALDVYHLSGNMKRIRFRMNDKIIFQEKERRTLYAGIITEITDSSFTFEKKQIVLIKDVACIVIDKSNFVTRGIPEFLMAFGGGFIVLDSFNNLVNGGSPVIKKDAVIEGIAFAASGWLFLRFAKKKYRVGQRCVLKVIDVTP